MRSLPPLAALLLAAHAATAAELLPAARPAHEVVDHYVDAALKDEGVEPAPAADDAALARRLTLDLAGRAPTWPEVEAFRAATGPDRVAKLVDRLMASPAYARHQADEFDVVLMQGTGGSVRNYLLPAFAENRPWDKVFRDFMLPPAEDNPKRRGGDGPAEFLKRRVKDLDRLTNDVSVAFFGVNVSCAQCHDHPLVDDWKQDHFFGLKSFFARTYEAGNHLGERDYGTVAFKTTKGADRQAKFMFLTGATADVPPGQEPKGDAQKKERELLERMKKGSAVPPPPAVSARGRLVELALKPGQREFFARAVVNRVWYRLFGYGLVMPLDQMHSENPPSHPELLDWLARDLIDHGYDLRRLTRSLVLSRAYARSGRWEKPGDLPPAHLFAVARTRPLTPLQLGASMKVATADPATFAKATKPDELERRLESLAAGGRGVAGLLEQPGENFQVGATEALMFSNADRVQNEFLGDGGLVGAMKKLATPAEKIDLAVKGVFGRPPTADEQKWLGDYLARRADRPAEACRQLVWALLTSSEFRFSS